MLYRAQTLRGISGYGIDFGFEPSCAENPLALSSDSPGTTPARCWSRTGFPFFSTKSASIRRTSRGPVRCKSFKAACVRVSTSDLSIISFCLLLFCTVAPRRHREDLPRTVFWYVPAHRLKLDFVTYHDSVVNCSKFCEGGLWGPSPGLTRPLRHLPSTRTLVGGSIFLCFNELLYERVEPLSQALRGPSCADVDHGSAH